MRDLHGRRQDRRVNEPNRRDGLRRRPFQPCGDDLGPEFRAVTMWEVAGVTDLPVRPGWVAGHGGAREGDWHDVVSIAVNDEHRASHVAGDSMEPRGSH